MKNFLCTNVGNLKLNNPVMVASGVCGFGEENRDVLNVVGGVVFKTVTLYPREGNPLPRVVDTPSGMLNSIGLENPGVDGIKDKLKDIQKLKCKRIASFLGNTEEEFFELLSRLEEYKIFDGYEVNLSCPNIKKGKWFFHLPVLKRILKKLRTLTNKPLIAKLSPEQDVIIVAKICKLEGYDGVTLLNTYTGIAVDYKNKKFCLGNIYGGLSGPCIKPLTLRWVYEVKKFVGIDVIGSGGIVEGKDAIEYFLAGSSAVQIGAGYFRNPQSPTDIIRFISGYLNQNKIQLKDIIGILCKQ